MEGKSVIKSCATTWNNSYQEENPVLGLELDLLKLGSCLFGWKAKSDLHTNIKLASQLCCFVLNNKDAETIIIFNLNIRMS